MKNVNMWHNTKKIKESFIKKHLTNAIKMKLIEGKFEMLRWVGLMIFMEGIH